MNTLFALFLLCGAPSAPHMDYACNCSINGTLLFSPQSSPAHTFAPVVTPQVVPGKTPPTKPVARTAGVLEQPEVWWIGGSLALVQLLVLILKKKRKRWLQRWGGLLITLIGAAAAGVSQLFGVSSLGSLLAAVAVLLPKLLHDTHKDVKAGKKPVVEQEN